MTNDIKFFVLILFLLINVCSCSSEDNQSSRAQPKARVSITPVEVISPTTGTAQAIFTANTTLAPVSEFTIHARTTGIVKTIYVEEGVDLKANRLLLELENDDQALNLQKAKQNLERAELAYARQNKMREAGVNPANEWDEALSALKLAKTDVEQAALELSYTKVKSPTAGRLVERQVDVGDYVNAGDALFRVMVIKPLLAKIFVPANRLGKLKVNDTATIFLEHTNQTIDGQIILISPVVDIESGTIKVTIEINDYPESIRPGEFVEVKLITDQRQDALILPNYVILEERGDYYVYVADKDSALRKNIKLGYTMADKREIQAGLQPTDRVISKGQHNLSPDAKIKIIPATPGESTKHANSKE